MPQRGHARQDDLVQVIEPALEPSLFRRARRAIARLGTDRLRQSYFTTFWLDRRAAPSHAVEEAVLALLRVASVRPDVRRCAGMEWWVGRSFTSAVPIGFHFDQDVKAPAGFRHPLAGSVLFFGSVRGGQLAVTDQLPGPRGTPVPTQPSRLTTVTPAANRYALFDGDRFHGVLDARGRTPGRPLAPRGRLRVTLVVNFWQKRPSDVPAWRESGLYRGLAGRVRTAP